MLIIPRAGPKRATLLCSGSSPGLFPCPFISQRALSHPTNHMGQSTMAPRNDTGAGQSQRHLGFKVDSSPLGKGTRASGAGDRQGPVMDEHTTLWFSFEVSLGHPHLLFTSPQSSGERARQLLLLQLTEGETEAQNSNRSWPLDFLCSSPSGSSVSVSLPVTVTHETPGQGIRAVEYPEGNSPFLSARRKICREETPCQS